MPITKHMILAIKQAMENAGLSTHAALAEESGVRRPTITDLLNGRQKDVRLSTLQKIAKACRCKVADLLGE